MSWLNTSVMEEKIRFIKMWESGIYIFSSLCESFGISRTTGYRLISQYRKYGKDRFNPKSKSPKNIPHKTPEKIEKEIVRLRKKHSDWGARKFKVMLLRKFRRKEIPSETTINAILKRNNLVKKRRKRFPKEENKYPVFDPKKCNEIWSTDYKGKFKIGNGRYCYPLTICDSKSRKIIAIQCHYNATFHSVKKAYIKAFREYGKPKAIHTDNGAPFGSIKAVRRFSKLCYWLVEHDIMPIFSDPGHPQQNGRHERMHRDLKAYCKNRIGNTLAKQQKVMEQFRIEYNSVRPHEALNMKTPDTVHKTSKIKFSEKIKPYKYPIEYKVLKVTKNGAFRWGAYHWVYVSSAAITKFVGVQKIGNGIWNVYFRNVLLGYFDEKQFTHFQQYLKLQRI